MKYYYFNGKIFKSHNKAKAIEYVNDRYHVEANYGKHKSRIKTRLIRLYDFDRELDK